MASWVKTPDNAYVQIGQIQRAYVMQFAELDNKWYIFGDCGDKRYVLKGPFADSATAQTNLDNAIVNLGGSV